MPAPQSSHDRHTYIPPSVQQNMARQMQQGLPAHLKQYVGNNQPVYVPQRVEKALTEHLQKSAPGHMKQYAGAYVQQNVVMPSVRNAHNPPSGAVAAKPPAPIPDQRRQDHSNVSASQYDAQFYNGLFQADSQNTDPGAVSPGPQPSPATSSSYQTPYDFILDHDHGQKRSMFPGSRSTLGRIVIFGGGLVVLLIILTVAKNILSGPSVGPIYVSVAQDQQAMIQVLNDASQQQDLSSDNKNFAATANLSLSSSQDSLLQYMAKNGKKVNKKQLALKVSSTTKQKLTTAAAAGTYNQTFDEVMQSGLTQYMSDIKQAYRQSPGKNGRRLLNQDALQAQLLMTQLKSIGLAGN